MDGSRKSILCDLRAAVAGFSWFTAQDEFNIEVARDVLTKLNRYLDNLEALDENDDPE